MPVKNKKSGGLFLVLALTLALHPSSAFAKKKHIPLDLAVLHNNQGVSFLEKNDLDHAEIEFKTAAEVDPLYPEAVNNLGLIYKYKGHYDKAIGELKKAIKLNSKWAAPYNHLATVYLSLGDYGRAIVNAKAATSRDKKFADAFYNLGVIYLERAKASEKASKSPKADWKSAVKAFQKATTIETKLFHAHMDLADTYRKLGQTEKAILRYRLAIETNPKDPTAWQHLGELYMATGDQEKAKACFEKVGLAAPMSEEALLKTGEEMTQQKKFGEAMGLFQRALETNFNNPMTHFDIGFLHYLQGNYPVAIQAYQQAIRLEPNFPPAWYNLGAALQESGDIQRARQSYCRFLAIAQGQFSEEEKKAKEAVTALGGCQTP